MKNPITTLLEEHATLSKAISIARKVQKVNDEITYRELMHNLIIFFRNFTEFHHHPKEEDILYPLLRNRTENMTEEFVHEICDNHEDFKVAIAEMETHYVNYNTVMLRKIMDNYLDCYEKHILEENKVVLEVASGLISDDEKTMINNEFLMLEKNKRLNSKEELNDLLQKINLAV